MHTITIFVPTLVLLLRILHTAHAGIPFFEPRPENGPWGHWKALAIPPTPYTSGKEIKIGDSNEIFSDDYWNGIVDSKSDALIITVVEIWAGCIIVPSGQLLNLLEREQTKTLWMNTMKHITVLIYQIRGQRQSTGVKEELEQRWMDIKSLLPRPNSALSRQRNDAIQTSEFNAAVAAFDALAIEPNARTTLWLSLELCLTKLKVIRHIGDLLEFNIDENDCWAFSDFLERLLEIFGDVGKQAEAIREAYQGIKYGWEAHNVPIPEHVLQIGLALDTIYEDLMAL